MASDPRTGLAARLYVLTGKSTESPARGKGRRGRAAASLHREAPPGAPWEPPGLPYAPVRFAATPGLGTKAKTLQFPSGPATRPEVPHASGGA